MVNHIEMLVTLDRDNKWIPYLAKDWRWIDERTIEFKLREDVRFHNGEKFNAEAVRANWEAYRRMQNPYHVPILALSDETMFNIVGEYKVRFILPEPDGLALVKFLIFYQFAPAFFETHKFDEGNWGYLPEAGPWGTGPYEFVEGSLRYARLGCARSLRRLLGSSIPEGRETDI
jgi:peptide/nickel transport system substrate-binding protein